MLNEPLISLILLLFVLVIAAALTVWFALTLLGGHRQAAPADANRRRDDKRPATRQVTVRPNAARTSADPPRVPPAPTPVRRLSNDQFRGAKVKARRRDEGLSGERRQESLEDAFERFIRSKNDDLNF